MAINFMKVRTGLTIKPNTAPSSPENGDIYYDTSLNSFKFYQNSALTGLLSSIGTIDGQTASGNGLVINGASIYAQSASATNPGMVNTTTQTLAGAKTFSTSITSPIYSSNSSNVAAAGVVRLANTDSIQWRNAANSANLSLQVDANNTLNYSGGSGFTINGSSSGAFTQKANATTTSYSVSWPAALAGTAGSALTSDTSGNLSWTAVPTSASYRVGSNSLSISTSSQAVTFSSALASTNYSVIANMINTTDTNPQFQPVTITAASTTGFTATWDNATDTGNYKLQWIAFLNN